MQAALPSWDEYAVAWSSLHGGIDPRQARPSVRRWLRFGYGAAKFCARARVRPGAVTAIGLVACVLTPVFAARGGVWAILGAMLVVLTAAADTVDGALAVITAHTTRLGYVYDAIVDRISEACWLLAFWLIGVPVYAVVAAGALTWIHEYARSRANAAGMSEIGAATVGERPTRVILAALGIGMAGLVGATSNALPAGIATFAVAVWVVLAIIGFAQLFATIHSMLAGQEWVGRARRRTRPEAATSTGRPHNLGLDPHYVAESRARARRAPRPETASEPDSGLSESGFVPADAPHSPGTGPAAPVIDADLLREISELDDLPGASVVYTSASVQDLSSEGVSAVAGDGRPETSQPKSSSTAGEAEPAEAADGLEASAAAERDQSEGDRPAL